MVLYYRRMKISQRYLTTNGIKYKVERLEKGEKISDEEIGNIIIRLRSDKENWSNIKNILKNEYDTEISVYKCKMLYKEFI
jgi:hypothetical protein